MQQCEFDTSNGNPPFAQLLLESQELAPMVFIVGRLQAVEISQDLNQSRDRAVSWGRALVGG